jgi:hypothetical protein
MMAARITRIQAFIALTQMLVTPLFFLSGAVYPLRSLPAWLDRSHPVRSDYLRRLPDETCCFQPSERVDGRERRPVHAR